MAITVESQSAAIDRTQEQALSLPLTQPQIDIQFNLVQSSPAIQTTNAVQVTDLIGSSFSTGQRVLTISPANVYSSASLTAAIIGLQTQGAAGTVTQGPVSADGVNWLYVDYDTAPSGWSPDSNLTAAPELAITANTWVEVQPSYQGAPDGGQLYPQGWVNRATYDPLTHRVIFSDRWYDTVRGTSIFANGIYAFDPGTNKFSVLKLNNWYAQSITCPNGQVGCYTTSPLPANSTEPYATRSSSALGH